MFIIQEYKKYMKIYRLEQLFTIMQTTNALLACKEVETFFCEQQQHVVYLKIKE